jgi:hypothetical protein
MTSLITKELENLQKFYDIEYTMNHFRNYVDFKFINKFDKSILRHKVDSLDILNYGEQAQKMISELNQIKKQFNRELKLEYIL